DNDGLSATDTCQIIVSEPYIPPPPLPPIADAGADQITDVDIELIFDGSGSYDPDGTIISYDWDFGDGAIGTGVNALHTYTTAGNYMVILTVTDDDGLSATDTCQITVTEPYVPDPIGAELAIDKIKIAGPDVVETHTKYGWTLRITVSNIGDSDAQDVVMHDVLPAELELVAFTKSTGTFTFKQNGGGQMGSTALTWEIGTMVSGQSETLDIVISTRLNPAGKQEFTSPGTYSLNDGAWVTGFDAITGEGLLAGPTPNITVVAVDGEDAEVEEENISPIEADSIYPDAIIHIIAENDIPDMDADEVESSVSASKKAATSYFSLFILALVGMIISVLMAAHIIDGKKEDDKTGKKEVNDQDEMLIKGEITEEEYVRKLKDMK
ncbi:MAG: PKD domain-containing protein, partial [Thermoplasmata archaeon]|nr:PKD domain-containing protein [Thermoplasmata archaeon]